VATVVFVRVRRRGVTTGMDGTANDGEAGAADVRSITVEGVPTSEFEWTEMVGRDVFCPSFTSSFTASSLLCPHCTQHTPVRMSAAPRSQLDERDSENRLAPHMPCNRKRTGAAQGKEQQKRKINTGTAMSENSQTAAAARAAVPADRQNDGCTLIVR
jgi:hypothetical protein